MGCRGIPKMRWAYRWIGLIALMVWVASQNAQALAWPRLSSVPPARACLALSCSMPGASISKVKGQQGLTSPMGNRQARVSERETGGDGCGSDLIPARPALISDPVKLESAGEDPASSPSFLSGWPAGENWPRPPPGS